MSKNLIPEHLELITYQEDDGQQDCAEEKLGRYRVTNIFVLCLRISAARGETGKEIPRLIKLSNLNVPNIGTEE